MHPTTKSEDDLLAECQQTRTRRQGPGGQHRNKVETAVVLTHEPTGVRAEANERRSQADNRREAIRRLRVKLAVAVRSDPIAAEMSQLWKTRVAGKAIRVNANHEDYPALLCECLDQLFAAELDLATTAARLQVTQSQIIKFLHRNAVAWNWFVVERKARELPVPKP